MNDEVYDKEVFDKEVYDKEVYDKAPYNKFPFSKQGQLSGNGGRSLLDFWLEPEQCLKYQLEMLRHQKLEGILSREILKVDNRLRLSYEITSLIPMSKLLERKEISRVDLLGWLKYIVDLWESLKNFMLDPEGLVMDSASIYVNPGTLEIYFVYLPVKGRPFYMEGLRDWVRSLLMNEIRFINEQTDDYVQKLLQLTKREDLKEEDLKSYLQFYRAEAKASEVSLKYESANPPLEREGERPLEHASTEGKARALNPMNTVSSLNAGYMDHSGFSQGKSTLSGVSETRSERIKGIGSGIFSHPFGKPEREISIDFPAGTASKKITPAPLKSQAKTRIAKSFKLPHKKWILLASAAAFAVILLAILFTKGSISLSGSADSLTTFGGLALIGAGGGYFLYSRILSKPKDKQINDTKKEERKKVIAPKGPKGSYVNASIHEPAESSSINTSKSSVLNSAKASAINSAKSSALNPAIPVPYSSSTPFSIPVPSEVQASSKATFASPEPASLSEMGTSSSRDLTMLLERDENHCPYLAFEKKGRKGDKIPLVKFPFMLGRMAEQVDYRLDNPTVGKMHAEIAKASQGYTITDLNSRNGTYINNERIKPGEAFTLSEGDRLSFSDEAFVFYAQGIK